MPLQRKIVLESNGAVVDGRDMGTVVFPKASLKIFLTACPQERAKRRYKELIDLGENVEFDALVKEILARDNRDKNRDIAPLKPAEDAIILDSTHLSQQDMTQKILELVVHFKI